MQSGHTSLVDSSPANFVHSRWAHGTDEYYHSMSYPQLLAHYQSDWVMISIVYVLLSKHSSFEIKGMLLYTAMPIFQQIDLLCNPVMVRTYTSAVYTSKELTHTHTQNTQQMQHNTS